MSVCAETVTLCHASERIRKHPSRGLGSAWKWCVKYEKGCVNDDMLGKAVGATLRTMHKSTGRVFANAHTQATSNIRCASLHWSSPCGTALLRMKGTVVRNSEMK